jgi:hypothetical protein
LKFVARSWGKCDRNLKFWKIWNHIKTWNVTEIWDAGAYLKCLSYLGGKYDQNMKLYKNLQLSKIWNCTRHEIISNYLKYEIGIKSQIIQSMKFYQNMKSSWIHEIISKSQNLKLFKYKPVSRHKLSQISQNLKFLKTWNHLEIWNRIKSQIFQDTESSQNMKLAQDVKLSWIISNMTNPKYNKIIPKPLSNDKNWI